MAARGSAPTWANTPPTAPVPVEDQLTSNDNPRITLDVNDMYHPRRGDYPSLGYRASAARRFGVRNVENNGQNASNNYSSDIRSNADRRHEPLNMPSFPTSHIGPINPQAPRPSTHVAPRRAGPGAAIAYQTVNLPHSSARFHSAGASEAPDSANQSYYEDQPDRTLRSTSPFQAPARFLSPYAWQEPYSVWFQRPLHVGRRSSTGGFQPMTSVQHQPNRSAAGISDNYMGNPDLPANQSADIPMYLNTSLWITNLPPQCNHRMLLASAKNCGKVFACVINPPEPRKNHFTAACKLVFFDVAGAQTLLQQCRFGIFKVGGYLPKARPNRIRSKAREPGPQSRVLHIEGPDCIVNEEFLNAFFHTKFTYQLESVTTIARGSRWTRQEWRFGSYRCQADAACRSIKSEKEHLGFKTLELWGMWNKVSVYFAPDPCAPPNPNA